MSKPASSSSLHRSSALTSFARPFLFLLTMLFSLFKRLQSNYSPLVGRLLIVSSQAIDNCWSHLFLILMRFLCLSQQQLMTALKVSSPMCTLEQIEPNGSKAASTTQRALQLVQQVEFEVVHPRSVMLLRVLTPTGFSVVIRVMVDTGCTRTVVSANLARLLLANGASLQYIMPEPVRLYNGEIRKSFMRLNNLTLQSVEDDSVSVPLKSAIIWDKMGSDRTPMNLVIAKMASFGLHMVKETPLRGTMWSKEEPNSQYLVDMLIGQDIMNRHFLMHPYQPTYHITPMLAVVRTKLGLMLSGRMYIKKFAKWTLNKTQAKRMRQKLRHPEAASQSRKPSNKSSGQVLSPQVKSKLDKVFDIDFRKAKLPNLKLHLLLTLYACLHLLVILAVAILLSFPLQMVVILTLNRHWPLPFLYQGYTSYLTCLFQLAKRLRCLHYSNLTCYLLILLGGTVTSDLMTFHLQAQLPLVVSNGDRQQTTGEEEEQGTSTAACKRVNALLDSGMIYSYISPRLVKELKLSPRRSPYFGEDCDTQVVTLCMQAPEVPAKCRRPGLPSAPPARLKAEFIIGDFEISQPSVTSCLHWAKAHVHSRLLQVPLFATSLTTSAHQLRTPQNELLLGNVLQTSLLMPSSHSPCCISLTPTANLSAIETPLGYYVQGQSPDTSFAFLPFQNGLALTSGTPPFYGWKSVLGTCVALDLLLLLAYFFGAFCKAEII